MTNTPFSKRVEILGDFYATYQDVDIATSTEFWQDWSDTMWICLASKVGYVTINDSFHWFIDQAWDALCNEYGVDKYGDYSDLIDIFELSNEQG